MGRATPHRCAIPRNLTIEAARLKLANAILAEVAIKSHKDVKTSKNAALQALALSSPRRDGRGAA
jgi:hypothetical protein